MSVADKIFKYGGQGVLLDLMKTMDSDEMDNLFYNEWGDNRVAEGRDESYKWGNRDIFVCVDFSIPWNSFFIEGYENATVEVNPIYWVGRNPLSACDMEVGTYYVQMSRDSDGDIVEAGFKLSEDCWRMTYIINDMNDDAVNSRIANEYSDMNFFKKDGTRIEL